MPICNVCGANKDDSEFYMNRKYRFKTCKECKKEYMRNYHAKTFDDVKVKKRWMSKLSNQEKTEIEVSMGAEEGLSYGKFVALRDNNLLDRYKDNKEYMKSLEAKDMTTPDKYWVPKATVSVQDNFENVKNKEVKVKKRI